MNNRNVIRDKTTRTYAFFSLCSARLRMTKTAPGKSETLLSHSLSFLLLTKPDTISPHSFFFMHLPVGQHSSIEMCIEITVVEKGFILFYEKTLDQFCVYVKRILILACCCCNTKIIDSMTLFGCFVAGGLEEIFPRKQLPTDLEYCINIWPLFHLFCNHSSCLFLQERYYCYLRRAIG